ncbi:MAG: hypothetical protein ABJE95_26020 [Byssovorax sp.]
MSTATPVDAALAEHARTPSGLPAAVLLLLLGVPFFAAGVNIALSRFGEGLGLCGVSMLFNLPAISILRSYLRVKRGGERIQIFSDRLVRHTTGGSMALPFSQLERLEGKITTFQRSGNQDHAYRLSFRGQPPVEIETSSHGGVNGDTGQLLQRVSGVSLQPWA